jgi:hypothetical protein
VCGVWFGCRPVVTSGVTGCLVWSRVNGTLGVPLTASVAGQRYPRGAVDRLHTHTLCSIYRYIVSNTPYSPYIDRTLGLFIDRAYIFRIQASLPGPAPPRYKVQVLSCLNCCLSLVSRPRYWTMTATAQPRKGGGSWHEQGAVLRCLPGEPQQDKAVGSLN